VRISRATHRPGAAHRRPPGEAGGPVRRSSRCTRVIDRPCHHLNDAGVRGIRCCEGTRRDKNVPSPARAIGDLVRMGTSRLVVALPARTPPGPAPQLRAPTASPPRSAGTGFTGDGGWPPGAAPGRSHGGPGERRRRRQGRPGLFRTASERQGAALELGTSAWEGRPSASTWPSGQGPQRLPAALARSKSGIGSWRGGAGAGCAEGVHERRLHASPPR